MKIHPLMTLGVVVVSVVAGYHLRSRFPLSIAPDPDTGIVQTGEPAAAPEAPEPRRSLAAIEAENEIRRAVEDRERTLAATPLEPLESLPVAVETFSAAPFHDELAPHGEWLHADDYGEVWKPASANTPEWRPYVDGSWAYTEAGWTWDSDEPCGDITCHYGRWVNLTDCGWCWVPGYDWAPAWVSWRCSDEFIGWAPLPPCVPWRPAAGLGPWVDACGDLGPGSYCFVPIRHFAAANCRPVLCPRSESTDHFRRTRNLTRLVCKPAADGRSHPVLEGPDVHRIATLSPKDLRHRRLRWVEASASRSAKESDRETLSVRRLAFQATAGPTEPSPKVTRRLGHATPADPWREAGDPQVLATARRQVFAEARDTFRGLPRLVPPVGSLKPTATRAPREETRLAHPTVTESPRPEPARVASRDSLATEPPRRRPTTLGGAQRPPAGSSLDPERLESASALSPRQPADRPGTRGAERLAAQAAREQQARDRLRQQQEAEAQAADNQQALEQRQIAQQQQAWQQQQLAAQREKDSRDSRVAEQRAEQARHQAVVERQQHQAELERREAAERQRQQAEARQHQELERRQQIEQARQQAIAQAREHEEARQRDQAEHSRRQAEAQARQFAAEQRERENEARQQQEMHRRQAEDHQRQQQRQEAQERAQAARQHQIEEARQRQQAEAGRQREQEAARQQGGHSQEKRGR